MFDNIIGQPKTVKSLVSDIAAGSLPQSILLSGPCYSGKMTIALELARILSCEKQNADWGCGCNSCVYHRSLSHQNTLILSQRANIPEIRASLAVLRRFDKPFSRYMFIRSVKKIIIRANPLLWEHNDSKLARVSSILNETEELLASIHPAYGLPYEEVTAAAEAIEKLVSDLLAKKVFSSITIDMVRNVSSWANTSSDFKNKIIIIDTIDELSDSCRNALLKILEEPPASLYIILLAVSKASIIPTILSRVRHYHTSQRSEADSKLVLSRIFREENDDFNSIRSFFLAYSDLNIEEVKNDCLAFIGSIVDKTGSEEYVNDFAVKYQNTPEEFLFELTATLQVLFANGEDYRQLSGWNRLINENLSQYNRYNTNPELVLGRILAGMSS